MVPQVEAEVTGARALLRRAQRRRPPQPQPLAHALTREAARVMEIAERPSPPSGSHRARLMAGLATSIAEKGEGGHHGRHRGHAHVSKRTFYEHFADKQECFVALYSETSDHLLALIGDAVARAGGGCWDERRR